MYPNVREQMSVESWAKRYVTERHAVELLRVALGERAGGESTYFALRSSDGRREPGEKGA